jgi:hypothetical protein
VSAADLKKSRKFDLFSVHIGSDVKNLDTVLCQFVAKANSDVV